jgi:hypothetical protein
MSDYNTALDKLYKHVDFENYLNEYPIEDRTDMFWSLDENGVTFAERCTLFTTVVL